tara:strand:+ start:262 stop:510 length:249 start_codon:yes stop_codon:yes gene_type:complete
MKFKNIFLLVICASMFVYSVLNVKQQCRHRHADIEYLPKFFHEPYIKLSTKKKSPISLVKISEFSSYKNYMIDKLIFIKQSK